MSQMSEDAKDFARMLRYVAECIDECDKIQSYDSCNTCAGSTGENRCPYLPAWGEMVRINCPLWYKEKK